MSEARGVDVAGVAYEYLGRPVSAYVLQGDRVLARTVGRKRYVRGFYVPQESEAASGCGVVEILNVGPGCSPKVTVGAYALVETFPHGAQPGRDTVVMLNGEDLLAVVTGMEDGLR